MKPTKPSTFNRLIWLACRVADAMLAIDRWHAKLQDHLRNGAVIHDSDSEAKDEHKGSDSSTSGSSDSDASELDTVAVVKGGSAAEGKLCCRRRFLKQSSDRPPKIRHKDFKVTRRILPPTTLGRGALITRCCRADVKKSVSL